MATESEVLVMIHTLTQAKECEQLLEARESKDVDSPLDRPEATEPC